MGVDYEQQLKDNETALADELKKSNESFDTTASKYQTVVDGQMQQLEKNKEEQTRLQQEQTDFTIDQIEQKQEQAEKDYTKEQQAAYGDYKRQTDPYGANAEQMAALGLSRSGYSESANVAMYTAYQNRVATARASFEQAKQTFDNAIREAKLTNDINLAKIAQETMEQSLALAMDSVVYLGNLELQKAATASSIKDKYYGIKQDILAAQEAERAAQQQEELLAAIQGSYNITQDTPVEDEPTETYYTGTIGNPGIYGGMTTKTAAAPAASDEADFSAVDAFFGDSVSDETVAGMINAGIITAENVNGVDVYKVADEAKARAYLAGNSQGASSGQTQQSKYNYSDSRVTAYFEQEDAVEELQKEFRKAKSNLALLEGKQAAASNPRANYGNVDYSVAVVAQQEYVNELKADLDIARRKLALMPKPVESAQYKTLNASYKEAKKAWEEAESYARSLKYTGVSDNIIKAEEEKAKKAKKAMDEAQGKLKSVEKYAIDNQGGYRPT